MKFLIQKIEGEIRHDFSLTLLESVRFKNWLNHNNKKDKIVIKYANTFEIREPDDIYPMPFKPYHKDYVPVGSVEFVTDFLVHFHNIIPKPINVPEELFPYATRSIWNADENGFYKGYGKLFIKSNDKIKGFTGIFHKNEYELPKGNYQFSEAITIESEWRVFVYQGKLVGLQNYSGDFTMFPDVHQINGMIEMYRSAPIAYTLDVGVFDEKTFVIECHPMISVGLYGFSNHSLIPNMLYRAFKEIINKNK